MLTNLRFPVADDHQFQCDVIRSLLERLHASAVYSVNGGDASFRARQAAGPARATIGSA